MRKTAIIAGITGQDGAYLSRILLKNSDRVVGFVRPNFVSPPESLLEIEGKIEFLKVDLSNSVDLTRAIRETSPSEIYNLTGHTVEPTSWDSPLRTTEANVMIPLRFLEIIRDHSPRTKFFQASSGNTLAIEGSWGRPLDETYEPISPYASTKLLSQHMTRLFREKFGLFAVTALFFNHESPYRGPAYVSRKISLAAALAAKGKLKDLPMGPIDSIRDWGFAGDYMNAAWLMMQQAEPRDFVIATGIPHTVQDLLEVAFGRVELNWKDYVRAQDAAPRAFDPKTLLGDPSRATSELGWNPTVPFDELIRMMVDADLSRAEK